MQARTGIAALAVGLIAIGCGSSASETETASGSPLAAALGFDDSAGFNEADFSEQQRVAEAAIAECMAAEGFEYTPVSTDAAGMPSAFSDDELAYDSREWAEKYGYGMSTTFADFEEQGGEGFEDPNQAYLESLGEDEQAAYYKTLYGDQAVVEFDSTEEQGSQDQAFEPSGCQGEAFEAAFGGEVGNKVFEEFGDELDDMWERMQADPRLVEQATGWSSCMREAGYEFAEPDEAQASVSDRMDVLFGEVTNPFDGISEEELDQMSDAELQDLAGGPPDIDDAALAEVSEYELAVAVVDWDCSEDLREIREEVSREYEQNFVDTNADRLAELKGDESS